MISTLGSESHVCWFWISFNISEVVAFEKKLIWALLGQLPGRARSVHIIDYCVHASTLDSAGQTCWFLISFNFSQGVAFEKKKKIWALLGKLKVCARSGFLRARKYVRLKRSNLFVLYQFKNAKKLQ